MKIITSTAVTPYGMCGFGYVDEGHPKEEALAKGQKNMIADFVQDIPGRLEDALIIEQEVRLSSTNRRIV